MLSMTQFTGVLCLLVSIFNFEQLLTLEVGKDANLFISKGDILNVLTNNVELIFLKGKQVSIENHQTELYQKYLSKYNLK